jgi:hypothetical protein
VNFVNDCVKITLLVLIKIKTLCFVINVKECGNDE